MLDTANMNTKVFEDVGWISFARFFLENERIMFIVAWNENALEQILYGPFKRCKIFNILFLQS